MAPHQITTVPLSGGAGGDVCRFGSLSIAHRSDALRRLCREMVALGLFGPAEVRSENGKLLLTIPAIERAAKWVRSETDARGLQLTRHQPNPFVEAWRATAGRPPAATAEALPATA